MTGYGIIGLGAWGRCYADALRQTPDSVLAASADKNDDYRELLKRPDIDVVIVCTPNDTHRSIGLDVLQAGKHLLIEKPFALTAAECDELIAAAEQNKRMLTVGHQFRLSPLWGKIKSLIDSGFIGVPKYVLIELSRNPYRQGMDNWRYDKNRVGNWILEEAIHFFDLATWYMQKFAEPVSVYAAGSTNQPDNVLFDNVSATVQFTNGGYSVIAQTLSAFEHHQTVKITGTKGSLWAGWSGTMDRTLTPSFFLKTFDGKQVEDVKFNEPTGEVFELQKQIAALSAKEFDKLIPADEARLAVVLSNAAQKSAETGTIIKT